MNLLKTALSQIEPKFESSLTHIDKIQHNSAIISACLYKRNDSLIILEQG